MIGTDALDRVIGADVYDADGDKIGTASEVYLDDQSGTPEWVTVKTGLFGTKQSFVPIREADLTGDGLRVPVSKEKVKDAPRIDTDGHLSPDEEQQLYRYYGMGAGGTGSAGAAGTAGLAGTAGTRETAGEPTGRSTDTDFTRTGAAQTSANTGMGAGMTDPTGDTQATSNTGYNDTTTGSGTTGAGLDTAGTGYDDRNQHGTRGHDTSGPTTDDAMTLSEERLDVGTEQVEAGRARLRKYVTTENVTETVPVSHEEVRVEREPITDADVGSAMDGPAISEEEHEVTLRAERPVVEKEAVPVERVRLGTETVTEDQQVSGTVRKEQVDTDGIPGDAATGNDRRL